jgi:hypothetical protein
MVKSSVWIAAIIFFSGLIQYVIYKGSFTVVVSNPVGMQSATQALL